MTRLTDAAEGHGPAPDLETLRAHGARLIAAATGDDRGTTRLAAQLRVLRLIAVMSESITGLRGTAG
jgi:hypothetical protein